MRGLKGRNAIVTGGASGIGRAICQRLGEEGCNVGVFDIDGDGAGTIAEAINSAGGNARAYHADIASLDAVKSAVASFEQDIGPTDVLVNNAGWDKIVPFLQTDTELWKKVIDINLYGPLHMHFAVLPGMVERRAGSVVNISSDAGRVGSSGEAVYSAAKGGIISFTKTMSRELTRSGIRLNTVCPWPDRHATVRPGRRGRSRTENRRGSETRHPDAAPRPAGRLSRHRRFSRQRRCRLHHRPDDQRFRRTDNARLMPPSTTDTTR